MQKLRDTSASLAQVADMVGYESEAAFSRAFKKAGRHGAGRLATFAQLGQAARPLEKDASAAVAVNTSEWLQWGTLTRSHSLS